MKLIDLNSMTRKLAESKGLTWEVGASGSVNATIAIIGEAPGEREFGMKIPLCGGSGALLWNVLRKYKITRDMCYVTNVCKRRVSLSETHTQVRDKLCKEEEHQWGSVIQAELNQLPNLQFVLILGNVALRQLLGHDGVNNWRGSVLKRSLQGSDRPLFFIVCNNPAQAKHNPHEEIIFRLHISKLDRVLNGNWREHHVKAIVPETITDALAALSEIEAASLEEERPLSYDIEVIAGETACVGMATDSSVGYCFPFRDVANNLHSASDEVLLRKRIAELLGNPKIKRIAQNGGFDATWLWFKDSIIVDHNWFDTMLAHHTLFPALPHGLGFLCTQYTDHPYYKDEKSEWREGGDISSFWEYNVKDCCITWEVRRKLEGELLREKMADFFFNHVMRLQPHIVRMNVGGALTHVERKQRFIEDTTAKLNDLIANFNSRCQELTGLEGYAPNPDSPRQIADLFFNKLGLIGRGRSIDKDNRNLILSNPRTSPEKAELLHIFGDIKKESKFRSTYAEMKHDEDQRTRTEYKQAGTTSAPGRLSSASPLWGTGGNLQNIPERAYPMFIADEGYGLGYFDLEQAEARVVGWKARIGSWIDQYERARMGEDLDTHRLLASEMFNVQYDEVPKKDRLEDGTETIRYYAKRSRHGFNYRLGPDTFSVKNKLPLSRGIQLHGLYLGANPELPVWWQAVEDEFREKRVLFNAYGRRLLNLTADVTYDMINTAIAFYPQSSVGDKVCRVIYQSESDPRWPMWARIWLNIHDALICIARLEKLKTCLSIMKEYAEEEMMVDGLPLIIPASTKISVPDEDGFHTWANLKEIKL